MDTAATGIADSPAGVEPASYFPTASSPIGPIPTDSEVDALLNVTTGFPSGWPSTSPDFVLESLQELDKSRCQNEKTFYKSYSTKWGKLDPDKRRCPSMSYGAI